MSAGDAVQKAECMGACEPDLRWPHDESFAFHILVIQTGLCERGLEGGRAAMIEATPLRFDAGRVVGISLDVFRRQWRPIVLLSLVVWAIAVAQNITGFAQYRHGSHDARRFAAYALFALAFVAVGWLRDASIVSVSLE